MKTDLLMSRGFPHIARVLRDRAQVIIRAWESDVRNTLHNSKVEALSPPCLRDHLPQIIEQVARAMESVNPAPAAQLAKSSAEHGVTRYQQHYDIESLLTEHRLFRRVIFDEVHLGLCGRMNHDEINVLNLAIDATLQKSVRAFVEKQNEQLRAAADGEAKFLSFLSHDLHNNLIGITVTLQVMSRRFASMPALNEEVEALLAARRSILETISGMERLLHAERIRKSPPKLDTAPVRLYELVSNVCTEFLPQAKQKGLQLTWAVPQNAVVNSNRELIKLVLQNIAGNAIKFSNDGEVRVWAKQGTNPHPPGWMVHVTDKGPGIAQEHQTNLFNAFVRGETHGCGGVGLGLAIAAQATRLLCGELSLESELGKGTTFTLRLPNSIKP